MLVQDVIKKIQDDIASLNRRISSISGGSVIDHGTLSGLADDDHVQYLLADGSRNLSSYIDIDEIADPGAPAAGDVRFFAHDEHLISLGEDDTWYDLSSGAFGTSSHIHAAITVTDEGGLNITWSAGEIFDAFISGGNQMVDTAAEPVNQAQTANTMNWLFYDQTAGGLDNSANEDDIKWNEGDFPVAAIGCSPTDILALHHFPLGNRELHNIKRVLFTALNAVVSDGLVISEHAGGGAFDVDLSAGTFVHLGIDVHNTSAIDSTVTNIIRWFHDAADNWTTDTNAQIDAANWDDPTDGAGIQPNANNKYYRSIFYTDGTYIHWLYPQEEFNTLAQAIAGDDPEPPDYLAHFPSCTVVVMKGDDAAFPAAGSDQWIDVRPTLGGAKIGGVVTDHGGLSGLGDDDHTQYLLVSGARAMAGNLDMGGNQITNVGTVDGVDISAYLDQSVKQAASPTFVTVKLSALTDGYVPYHVSDAAGLANSGIFWDGANKIGINVIPSAWATIVPVIEIGSAAAASIGVYNSGVVPAGYYSSNLYFNGSNWIYKASYPAIQYIIDAYNARFQWFGAPSGTAGNIATLIERMKLEEDGSLYVYDTDDDVLREVSFGADDSGGAGFKVLRIPN